MSSLELSGVAWTCLGLPGGVAGLLNSCLELPGVAWRSRGVAKQLPGVAWSCLGLPGEHRQEGPSFKVAGEMCRLNTSGGKSVRTKTGQCTIYY